MEEAVLWYSRVKLGVRLVWGQRQVHPVMDDRIGPVESGKIKLSEKTLWGEGIVVEWDIEGSSGKYLIGFSLVF